MVQELPVFKSKFNTSIKHWKVVQSGEFVKKKWNDFTISDMIGDDPAYPPPRLLTRSCHHLPKNSEKPSGEVKTARDLVWSISPHSRSVAFLILCRGKHLSPQLPLNTLRTTPAALQPPFKELLKEVQKPEARRDVCLSVWHMLNLKRPRREQSTWRKI